MNKRPHMQAFARPAGYYPTEHGAMYSHPQEGMSLRDYFAAKALQGLLSCSDIHSISTHSVPDAMKATAKWSYALADAMLKAREE